MVPMLGAVFYGLNGRIKGIDVERKKAAQNANACSRQAIFAHETVQAFNAQQFELSRFQAHLLEAQKWGAHLTMINALMMGAYFFITFLAMAFVFWWVI